MASATRTRISSRPAAPGDASGHARLYFLDYLRAGVVALVLLHHTAITYGATGSWYFYDAAGSSTLVRGLLTLFVAYNQSWFMAFLFFVSGYLALPSYGRKGAWRYVVDRLRRFGIPLLVYASVISPVTLWLARLSDAGHPSLYAVYAHQHWFSFGVLWFVEALLLMDLVLVALARWVSRLSLAPRWATRWPGAATLSAFVLSLGFASYAVRFGMPLGANFAGLNICYFPSYIAMFALGVHAWRARWLDAVPASTVRFGRALLLAGIVLLPVLLVGGGALAAGGVALFAGGAHWQALSLAVWEQTMLVGVSITVLAWGLRRLNRPSPRVRPWADASYLAYIVQPLVIVPVALAFHAVAWPALVRFLVVGSISVVATYLAARALRTVTVVRRIVD